MISDLIIFKVIFLSVLYDDDLVLVPLWGAFLCAEKIVTISHQHFYIFVPAASTYFQSIHSIILQAADCYMS